MKFGVITPLAGGLPIAISQCLNTLPEFVADWNGYMGNSHYYKEYIEQHGWNGKWIELDKKVDASDFPSVDIVCAIPVCKGLSSLSNKSCAENDANKHMLDCARLALDVIRPKLYIFENAPHLATSKGKPVADRLYQIANASGYNLLLFATGSKYEGNCQKRLRTYAIFFRRDYFKSKTPLFEYRQIRQKSMIEIVQSAPNSSEDPMNILINKTRPSNAPIYKIACFLKFNDEIERTGSVPDISTHAKLVDICSQGDNFSMEAYIFGRSNVQRTLKYAREQCYESVVKKCERVIEKYKDGKNAFIQGFCCSTNEIAGLTPPTIGTMMHPIEDRFLTIREAMKIMDMPDDYYINPKDIHVIYQNVGCDVVKSLWTDIGRWLQYPTEMRSTLNDYVIQYRHNDNIIYRHEIEQSELLEDLFI